MNEAGHHMGFLRELTWYHILLVIAVLVGCLLLVQLLRRIVHYAAEIASPHRRPLILRTARIVRLLIGIAGLAIIIQLLVEANVITVLVTATLALAFAIKHYVSCLVAGGVTILENAYRPGDCELIDTIIINKPTPMFDGPPGIIIIGFLMALAAYLRLVAVAARDLMDMLLVKSSKIPYPYHNVRTH